EQLKQKPVVLTLTDGLKSKIISRLKSSVDLVFDKPIGNIQVVLGLASKFTVALSAISHRRVADERTLLCGSTIRLPYG
ncbi:hypothetical protein L9F63_005828, partial [Diploptera punctata]